MEETAIISKPRRRRPSAVHQTPEPPKNQKSTKSQTLRSLAKKFLPFLNRALSLLPKRLADPSKLDEEVALELSDIYRLCLYCLTAVMW
ncbi:hypothetical protein ACFX14_044496 [Malus domestica]